MFVEEGGHLMQLFVSGTDRTGIILYVSRMACEGNVNILSCVTNRLEEQFSGTYFILEGDRSDIRRFHERLKQTESDSIPGKQILPEKLYDLRIEGTDRKGMLCDITGILNDHDVNIVTMGVRTVEQFPDDFDFSNGEDRGLLPRRTFIHIRTEVPREQLQRLTELEERLRRVGPDWRLSVKEWKRSVRPQTVEMRRMFEDN